MAPPLAAGPASGLLLKPLVPPSSGLRNKDFILERCATTRWAKNHGKVYACNSQGKLFHQITADSSSLFTRETTRSLSIPLVSQRAKSMICKQAFIYNSYGFRVPAAAEKPEWWWRTLSCIPYLIALQLSDTGSYLLPILENFQCFEDLVYFIPGAINRLPSWFPMIYCYFALVGVVKNKEWPLFFRFHVMMGLLLETGVQVVWVASNFLPLIHYNGTLGMYYWAGVGLAYILLVLECVRCALAGTFVKIPLFSRSAFLHSLFNLGGFQRPF